MWCFEESRTMNANGRYGSFFPGRADFPEVSYVVDWSIGIKILSVAFVKKRYFTEQTLKIA